MWARPLADGAHAVALLNRGDARATVHVQWEDVSGEKSSRRAHVRDLWERADVGERSGFYDRTLEAHACALLKVRFA